MTSRITPEGIREWKRVFDRVVSAGLHIFFTICTKHTFDMWGFLRKIQGIRAYIFFIFFILFTREEILQSLKRGGFGSRHLPGQLFGSLMEEEAGNEENVFL